jgi:hypothetical protein
MGVGSTVYTKDIGYVFTDLRALNKLQRRQVACSNSNYMSVVNQHGTCHSSVTPLLRTLITSHVPGAKNACIRSEAGYRSARCQEPAFACIKSDGRYNACVYTH